MGYLDRFKLDGKVAIVTGSSRGIGNATAARQAQPLFTPQQLWKLPRRRPPLLPLKPAPGPWACSAALRTWIL